MLGFSAVVTVTGVVLAVVGNNKAKDAANAPLFTSEGKYNKSRNDAKSGQTLLGIGAGLAIAGAVGIGLSFAF